MARKRKVTKYEWKMVTCCKCGDYVSRHSTLAVKGTRTGPGRRSSMNRACRDTEACTERQKTKDNKSVLKKEAEPQVET